MTGLALGLCGGLGLFCVWWSAWPHEAGRRHRPRPRRERWEDDLRQAGLSRLGLHQLVLASIGASLVVLAVARVVTGALPIAVSFAAMAAAALPVAVRARARRRRSLRRDLWPDAVDNLASAVRAGLSLPEALSQLAVRGPDDLRPAFDAFAQDYRSTGRFSDSLDLLKSRLADPVGDRVVESLRVARDVGGSDVGRLLRTLSTFLRQDARTRAELESRQGWTVNGARLAVAAPWVVLALLSTRPESVAAYDTPAGAGVLATGAGLTLGAYHLMLRIARLPTEQRVLR